MEYKATIGILERKVGFSLKGKPQIPGYEKRHIYTDSDDFIGNYLKSIKKIKLLNEKEEIELGKKIAQGCEYSEEKMVVSNLRLVVSVAKKYTNKGLSLSDLISHGNHGLIKSVQRYDHKKGYKFSTYAVWWIRQTVLRGLSEEARSIRLPSYILEDIGKIGKISRAYWSELKRDPTKNEIASEMDLPIKKIETLFALDRDILSLDYPVGDKNYVLGDYVEDKLSVSVEENGILLDRKSSIEKVLNTLTPKESSVIKLRFGIDIGYSMTLQEIGEEFGVTRERIRQIEVNALNKLKHPTRKEKLREFY